MALSYIDDHVDQALARCAQQYKQSTRLLGLLEAVVDQVQALDDAFWQLATERYLFTDAEIGSVTVNYEAVGVQLNVIGRILGEDRANLTDDQYRLVLKGKIRILRSSGTAEELVSIFHALFPDAVPTVTTRLPAYVSVQIDDPITATEAAIGSRFLRQGRAAGVHGSFRWQQSATAGLFQFDSGPGFDLGKLAGSKRS